MNRIKKKAVATPFEMGSEEGTETIGRKGADHTVRVELFPLASRLPCTVSFAINN